MNSYKPIMWAGHFPFNKRVVSLQRVGGVITPPYERQALDLTAYYAGGCIFFAANTELTGKDRQPAGQAFAAGVLSLCAGKNL